MERKDVMLGDNGSSLVSPQSLSGGPSDYSAQTRQRTLLEEARSQGPRPPQVCGTARAGRQQPREGASVIIRVVMIAMVIIIIAVVMMINSHCQPSA